MAKATKHKRLILLDAHAILHRAFHALPDFSTAKGEPTGALYGIATMLMKTITELKPDYLVACYDLPGGTFRHEAYEKYKATRMKADDALVAQMDRSRSIFAAFGIPIYEHKGFEADDMLGTIVEQVKENKELDIVIASGDLDTLQLVDKKKVMVYTLRKGLTDTAFYDEAAVEARFGFSPKSLPDYKGLRGDPSDNIIGVPGVGEKTAAILIKEFGSIEEMYKALKKSKERFKKIGITDRVVKLLEEHKEEAEFSKMLASIRRDAPINFTLPELFSLPARAHQITELFNELEFRSLVARVRTLAGTPLTMDFQSESEGEGVDVDAAELTKTSVALWLLKSDLTNPTLEDILHYAKSKNFADASKKIFADLAKTPMLQVWKDIEEPLIPVLREAERQGVKIDRAYLEKLSKEYHVELAKLEKKIFKLAGSEFNVNSPRQLGEVLFDKLKLTLKNHKKTSTGQKTTRESELEKLRDQHPIIAEILAHRELQKLLSTYIDTIPGLLDDNSRLHTTFLQAGAATGRMATQNPGLQNIPIRTELGRAIRNAFIAEKGFVVLSLDYSQIELRLAAILSGDKKLIDIFKQGGDIHASVASAVFKVPLSKVDAEMRRRAKTINFGILYGMGAQSLRVQIGTTLPEARTYLDEYFKTFSGLTKFIEETKLDAARRGYTETLFGRRRYFEGLRSPLPYIKAASERMAVNAPLQGTQADIIKIAMVRANEMLKYENLERDAQLVLQVHDELLYEVRETKVKEIGAAIAEIMRSVLSPSQTKGVPILVSVNAGISWGEQTKLTI